MAWHAFIHNVQVFGEQLSLVVEYRSDSDSAKIKKTFHYNVLDPNLTKAAIKTTILGVIDTLDTVQARVNALKNLVGTEVV